MNHCRLCCRFFPTRKQINTSIIYRWHNQYLRSCQQAPQYSANDGRKADNGKDEEDKLDAPYTFSTSKAANWSVDKSFGSQYSRPWWKVAPLSLALVVFVAWIFLRSETELDRRLEVTLGERLPDLFPPSDPEGKSDATEAEDAQINTR